MLFNVILTVIGALVFLNALAATIASHWHTGVVVCYLLGAALMVLGLFGDHFGRVGEIVRVAAAVVTGIAAVCVTALFLGGTSDTVTYHEDAIVVLGASVVGKVPSKSLAQRLDVAVTYHDQNPEALIVVSGGQGSNEQISEAAAMRTYLLENGVDEACIVTEDRSTSTAENFEFSKAILDEHFDGDYTIGYITSDFHIFRAGCIARDVGYEDVTHAHSHTTWYTVVTNGVREILAVVKTGLFD